MPPKKTTEVRKASPVAGEEETPGKESSKDLVSIEDHTLPKSIVTRLAKGVLPPNTQIQANATLAITKGATVFVNYLASQANEICQREGRKTLNPADVLRALDDLEFPDFKPRLEAELAKFNEIQTEKRSAYRAKKTSEKTTTSTDPTTGDNETQQQARSAGPQNGNGEPVAKKARMEVDDTEGPDDDVEDSNMAGDQGLGDEEDQDDDVEEDGEDEEDTLEVDGDDAEEPEEPEEEKDEALDNGDDSD